MSKEATGMRCEIVKCDACGQEIRPGTPIIRVMRGLCGVVPSPVDGGNRAAEFHAECVHVGYTARMINASIPLPLCVYNDVMKEFEKNARLMAREKWRAR